MIGSVTHRQPVRGHDAGRVRGLRLTGLLMAVVALALLWTELDPRLSGFEALSAVFRAPASSPAMAIAHFSFWPRIVVALLAGGGLAIAGVLMQQVLKNPLAAPMTLGVAGGAKLALAAATLFAPAFVQIGREWVALAGGGVAIGLVLALTWRQQLSPAMVVLAGLVINLYFGALGTLLVLLHPESLSGVLLWDAGELTQNNWDTVAYLAPRLGVALGIALLLLRPLGIMALDDANARSLGVPLHYMRFASLAVAVFVTACVVSAIGVIGFIGLAAPAIARLLGARRLGHRLLWAMLLGALMLLITDLLVQRLDTSVAAVIPTGAMTGALGAPLLLWLIPRVGLGGDSPDTPTPAAPRQHTPGRRLLALGIGLLAVTVFALVLGRGADGWLSALSWSDVAGAFEWRAPRVLAAGAGGIMLALAGTILQRITGNPMASPEVLGISAGTAIGLIAGLFVLPGAGALALVGTGSAGAVATLALLIVINRARGFTPGRVLLSGIALAAAFDALRSLVLAGGDPRGIQLLAWIYGSTYYVNATTAGAAAIAALVSGLACWPLVRWLNILPLGADVARTLGVPATASRLILLGLACVLTAGATLIIGPLSFVGLLAPHMARLMGFERAGHHLTGAALTGAVLMIGADWAGRQLLFPQDIPAGLVASVLGGAYFMWALRRV